MTNNVDPLSAFDEPEEESFDAGEAKAVNIARQQASRDEANKKQVIVAIMGQEPCRQWMYEILTRCHIYGNSLIPGDPYTTHFHMGEENIGKMLLADLMEAAPEDYVQMCKEGRAREEANAKAIQRATIDK